MLTREHLFTPSQFPAQYAPLIMHYFSPHPVRSHPLLTLSTSGTWNIGYFTYYRLIRSFLCLEYCGTRAVPSVETSDYLMTLGNKLNPKINIMWTGKSFLLFYFVTLIFLLIYYWWMLVLLSTCPVSFSSVGEGQILACFFYAWLKVQLHLSFSFPASQPARISESWKLHISMVSCVQ